MEQTILNILIGVVLSAGGWILKTVQSELKELRARDELRQTQLSEFRIVVAEDYVKHQELQKFLESLNNKLDRIEEKLDKKVDK